MNEHVDPEFNTKYGFCRVDCEECDRLDKIDLATLTPGEILQRGLTMATNALAEEATAL